MMIMVLMTRQENADFFGVEVGATFSVDFETYVAAVVASEVGNSSLEVCKAQAVAARTFAVSKGVLSGKTITDTSSRDQAYRADRFASGLYPNAEQGAKATAGQILTYNGQPINAVYSASNGGRTVSSQERWGGVRPYLIAQDDPWDNAEKRTGHGVGLSQLGAKAMAAAGKDYREILAFYYPGTALTAIEEKGDDQKMVTAKQFIEQVKIPLNEGWGYIYGTWGSLWTKEKQQAATREMTIKYGSRWIGKMVTDCSGLVRWALKQLGVDVVHHATYLYTDWCKVKGQLQNGRRTDGQPLKPGSLVFLKGAEAKIHHVGVYVGDGIVIEAKGTQAGVITSGLEKWDHWGECKLIDYTNAADLDGYVPEQKQNDVLFKGEVDNPNTWLNVRSGPGKHYTVQFQVQKGTIVDVLAESGEWYQIRSGGRIGWASAEYILPLPQEEPEAPILPDDDTDGDYDDDKNKNDDIVLKSSVITDLESVLSGLSDLENRVADILRRL